MAGFAAITVFLLFITAYAGFTSGPFPCSVRSVSLFTFSLSRDYAMIGALVSGLSQT